jgi:hypothetical protein
MDKLRCMQRGPVKDGFVQQPEQWMCSYTYEEAQLLIRLQSITCLSFQERRLAAF